MIRTESKTQILWWTCAFLKIGSMDDEVLGFTLGTRYGIKL